MHPIRMFNVSVVVFFLAAFSSICMGQDEETDDQSESRYWVDKGQTMWNNKQYEVALSCYRKHLEYYPEDVEAIVGSANASQVMGKNEEAVKFCKAAIKIDPSYAFAYTILAAAYRNMSKLDEAVSNCKKAIALDPSENLAYGIIGEVHYRRKEYTKAVEMIKRSIAILKEQDRENASAYHVLGNIYLDMNDPFSASICYNNALNVDTRFVASIYSLSAIYYDREQYDSSLVLLYRIINENLENTNTYVYQRLARCFEGTGDYSKMVKYAQMAFEGDQEDDAVRSLYVRALRMSDDGGRALEVASHSKKQDNSAIAYVYFCLGDADQSKRYSDMYIVELKRLAKKGEDIDVNMGWAFIMSHNMEEAIKLSKQATQKKGNSIAELNLALAYLCKGDLQTARNVYQKAMRDATIRELRAAIHDIRCAESYYKYGNDGDELISQLEGEIEKRISR